MSRIQSSEQLAEVVANSRSMREVIDAFGYRPTGGIYVWLKQKLAEYSIDCSHFSGQGWAKGKTRATDAAIDKTARKQQCGKKEAFSKGSKVQNRDLLKRLVLEEGRPYACEICGLNEWRGRRLRLRLDHENGDRSDCRESNLRILCPNCDSQTPTHSLGLRKKSDQPKWWEQI